jgi:hypothetical protein
MSKGLTAGQQTEIEGSQVKTRVLLTLTLRDEDTTVIRILENDTLASLSHGGVTFVGAMVKRGQIESHIEGGPQKVNIRISNIGQGFSALVADQGDVLTNSDCLIEELIYVPPGYDLIEQDGSSDIILLENGGYLMLDNDYIVGDSVGLFEGKINNVKLTESEFSFDVERILGGYSTQSPNTTYDVNCQWGFKDSRCQYSGVETTCDKTLTSCQGYSNETRFGGYPSIPAELVIKG